MVTPNAVLEQRVKAQREVEAKLANKRRRQELERNRERAVQLCVKHLGRNESAYVNAFRRVTHVDLLIRKGIEQGRWAA